MKQLRNRLESRTIATVLENGKMKHVRMSVFISWPISKELLTNIIACNLLHDYVLFSKINGIDIFCRIWASCCAGEITRQECSDLFDILQNTLMYECKAIFTKACCEWDPLDPFLFDRLPCHMFSQTVVRAALLAVCKSRIRDPEIAIGVQHYLNLCCFMVERGYAVEELSVMYVLKNYGQVAGVVTIFRTVLLKFTKSFRVRIYDMILSQFGCSLHGEFYGLQCRMADYYHLLADAPAYAITLEDWDFTVRLPYSLPHIKDNLTRCYGEILFFYLEFVKRGLGTSGQDILVLRKCKEAENTIRLILYPETRENFVQVFQAASPWWKESIRMIMTLNQVPENVVHLLPRELIFLIVSLL